MKILIIFLISFCQITQLAANLTDELLDTLNLNMWKPLLHYHQKTGSLAADAVFFLEEQKERTKYKDLRKKITIAQRRLLAGAWGIDTSRRYDPRVIQGLLGVVATVTKDYKETQEASYANTVHDFYRDCYENDLVHQAQSGNTAVRGHVTKLFETVTHTWNEGEDEYGLKIGPTNDVLFHVTEGVVDDYVYENALLSFVGKEGNPTVNFPINVMDWNGGLVRFAQEYVGKVLDCAKENGPDQLVVRYEGHLDGIDYEAGQVIIDNMTVHANANTAAQFTARLVERNDLKTKYVELVELLDNLHELSTTEKIGTNILEGFNIFNGTDAFILSEGNLSAHYPLYGQAFWRGISGILDAASYMERNNCCAFLKILIEQLHKRITGNVAVASVMFNEGQFLISISDNFFQLANEVDLIAAYPGYAELIHTYWTGVSSLMTSMQNLLPRHPRFWDEKEIAVPGVEIKPAKLDTLIAPYYNVNAPDDIQRFQNVLRTLDYLVEYGIIPASSRVGVATMLVNGDYE